MKTVRAVLLGASIVLLGLAAWAQEFPRAEVAADYSYARFNPTHNGTNGHSLNGGGGGLTYNFNEYLGIKMDLQGYGSNTSHFIIPSSVNFPAGGTATVQGNLFTYLFGPQIKFRMHHFQPYGQYLLGGAHSNVYGNAFHSICQPIAGVCSFSAAPSGNAFAMSAGFGLDIPINKTIAFRPAEVDWLYTKFTNQFSNSSQNSFKYSAGVVFSFGGTQ
jgi:hypothetical protein